MARAVLMASEFSSAGSVIRMPRCAPIASARRSPPPDGVDRLGWAHRDDRDLAGILLDKLESRLDPVLVTRVENEVDALADQPPGLRVELAGRVRIGNLLHADEDIHRWLHPLWRNRSRS